MALSSDVQGDTRLQEQDITFCILKNSKLFFDFEGKLKSSILTK